MTIGLQQLPHSKLPNPLLLHTNLLGLVYRLFWTWLAGVVAAAAGVESYSGKTGSEPNCSAPNWRLRPEMSVDPGISTAIAGI